MDSQDPTHRAQERPIGIGTDSETEISKNKVKTAKAQEPLLLEAGAKLGRYLILGRLGQGGMGAVYAAHDPQLDRRVAIKVLRPESIAGMSTEVGRGTLFREARAMARLSHPNVVAIHDVDEAGEVLYLSMDYVEGASLRSWLNLPPPPNFTVDSSFRSRPWQEVVPRFVHAGRGVVAAHRAGLIHRDFKPDNVLVGKDGSVRVTDFGLASPADPTDGKGVVAGTPGYMAPEQYMGLPADERTDAFAFCVSLWEGLYGIKPFQGKNLAEVARAAARADFTPPPPSVVVPRWLVEVLRKGLAPRREERASLDWLKSKGDLIETDKAVFELPCPQAGRVTAILVGPGTRVAVGTPLLTLEAEQDATAAAAGASPSSTLAGFLVTNNSVNTATVGTYTVTYNVHDTAGNVATQVTRTVKVTDQTPPVITLLGTTPVTVAQGGTYTDAGVTLSDNVDSPATLAGRLVTNNPVNTSVVGTYTVTYNLTDTANNAATQVTRG